MNDTRGRLPWTRSAGWGAFLACSWTWVIGMWLPVLLVEDFGWPGWLVFVVPNVLGAMTMGLWLRGPGLSEAMLTAHHGAARWFSIVTLLFHVSFLVWWLAWACGAMAPALRLWVGIGAAAAIVSAAWLTAWGGGWVGRAVAVLLVSIGAWIASALTSGSLQAPSIGGERPFQDLLWATPIIVFGFALCPYLDATFHRARQANPGLAGDAAFVLGFGVFFLAMMVFSLLYGAGFAMGRWSYYLVLHVTVQSWFTMSAHLRELLAPDGLVRKERDGGALGMALMVAGALALGAGAATIFPRLRPELPATRLLYYLFLGCYALPLPAYVWIVMRRKGSMGARMAVWLCATLVGAPCLWMGFVEGRYAWLVGAAAAPILAPLALRPGARRGEAAVA